MSPFFTYLAATPFSGWVPLTVYIQPEFLPLSNSPRPLTAEIYTVPYLLLSSAVKVMLCFAATRFSTSHTVSAVSASTLDSLAQVVSPPRARPWGLLVEPCLESPRMETETVILLDTGVTCTVI